MKDSVNFGKNQTGIQMAPIMSKEMIAGVKEFAHPNIDTSVTFQQMKESYINESGTLGTVPLPGTMKGALSGAMQKLKGNKPAVLIDKLGERLAFERSGVRLYDALLLKCSAAMPNMSLDTVRSFREEEAEHFFRVKEVMEAIGADPTAMTPCADSAAVASMGIMQVLNDPRTTIPQCVEAILIAELADNDGWDLLIKLVEDAGLKDAAENFRVAKQQEDKHLLYMRQWLQQLTLEGKETETQH